MSMKQRVFGALAFASAAIVTVATILPVTANGAGAGRIGGWYLYGSNMPWLNWAQDFGGGPSGGGVSGNTSLLDSKLQQAHNADMHIIRWWVFEGGSPQIQRDASGTATSFNPNVYTDIDAALNEAAKYDISYNFVLFGGTNDDATTHDWWENPTKRQALVNVLAPLFKRYASNPRVHTWEIVNEPEWQSRNGQTTVAGMLATGDAIANAVHQNSPALVTVGNAQIQDMQTWVGHPLDYYSPHYYDNFGTGSNDPFVNPANSPDGKPVVIGEFPASSGLSPDALSRWKSLYANGYAGAWNWSWAPEFTGDHLGTDVNAATTFAGGKTDLGPRGSAPAPTATPGAATATPVPPTVVPAATATPAAQTAWTLRASTGSTSVARGASVRLTARVTSNQNATALVDLEVYDQSWNKVYQRAWDSQSFTANKARSFATTWTVTSNTATGTYTVMVGTFGPNWNGVYEFDNQAAGFTVR